MALSLLALTLIAGLVVVVRNGLDGDEALLATRSDSVPEATTTTDPPPADQEEPAAPTTSEPAPSDPEPTTTSTPSTTTSTTAPPRDDVEAECPGLESQTFWLETGDRSVLEAAAGTAGTYVEVVTNRSDEPCRIVTSRCGTTAELRTVDGSPTDSPSTACPGVLSEDVLDPGERRREELSVWFPVPPGDYRAHVHRYDGSTAVLPVRLDDRLPPCDPARLSLDAGGEQFLEQEHVRDHGFAIDLYISGADETCSVRVVESRLVLVSPRQRAALVDETERWSVPRSENDIHTHAVAPPTELQPATYESTVTLLLDDGGQLTAPFRLLVG